MNVDLKKELERRVPDSAIPPLSAEVVKVRGRRLAWRRRLAFASACLIVAAALGASAMLLLNEPAKQTRSASPSKKEALKPPAQDSVVSLEPNRLHVGDRATLRVRKGVGFGVAWKFEHRRDQSWKWIGYLKAGPLPGWEEEFFLFPGGDAIEDIAFKSPAAMRITIPDVEPGRYRLAQEFVRVKKGNPGGTEKWRYVEFDVLE